MMDCQFVYDRLKASIGLLLAGVMWISLSAATAKTASLSTGAAQQLEGIVARKGSEWPWSVGGRSAYLAPDTDSVYELNNPADEDLEIQTPSQEWFNLNRGDGSRGFVRTPIVRF